MEVGSTLHPAVLVVQQKLWSTLYNISKTEKQSNLADFQVCRYYQFVQQTSVAKETTIYIYMYISVAVLAVQGSRYADRADCLSTDGAQGCCRC